MLNRRFFFEEKQGEWINMVRAAALVSGDGAKLQAILDSMYFKEIPDFELVAVISSEKDAYAMKRALNARESRPMWSIRSFSRT